MLTPSDPRPDLLPSLGRLVRGLVLLFWAVPLGLVICVQTARTELLAGLGFLPALLSQVLVLHALFLIAAFQPHERIWRRALDRARALALVNLGLAPFLHWWRAMPEVTHYQVAVTLMAGSGLGFLAALNAALRRLAAMLPDATLRLEVRLFTSVNLGLLLALGGLALGLLWAGRSAWTANWPPLALGLIQHFGPMVLLILALLPVALTMTLIWKIKETILHSVFQPGTRPPP